MLILKSNGNNVASRCEPGAYSGPFMGNSKLARAPWRARSRKIARTLLQNLNDLWFVGSDENIMIVQTLTVHDRKTLNGDEVAGKRPVAMRHAVGRELQCGSLCISVPH